ncbi:hypothetical protein BGZ57DRAFT_967252 [Hyaloscypha finlandica]|nr:hypothetical protein BGZ57DRAFT_967252 [Hyaloscypha finlandica]
MDTDNGSSEFLLGEGSKPAADQNTLLRSHRAICISLLLVILLCIQILILQVVVWRNSSPPHASSSSVVRMHGLYCGNSSTDARIHGCHFDVFSFGWYPLECWDDELYNDFLERHETALRWETVDGTPVDVEEVKRGEHEFLISTWEFHLIHCLWAWEKMERAVLMKMPLDEWSLKYSHTQHCVHELMHQDQYEMQEMMTSATMFYPICGLSDSNLATLLGQGSSST